MTYIGKFEHVKKVVGTIVVKDTPLGTRIGAKKSHQC